jgi:hypothetical protein
MLHSHFFPSSLNRRRNTKTFTVFCDSPASYIYVLFFKFHDYRVIGQNIIDRFCVDQLLDTKPDSLSRMRLAVQKVHEEMPYTCSM